MSTLIATPTPVRSRIPLIHRQLSHYPSTARRYLYLFVTVLATVTLYYELYVQGSVATTLIEHFHFSFTAYVFVLVVGNGLVRLPRSAPVWPIVGAGPTWSSGECCLRR